MKTSIVLLALIFINTTALLSEPLAALVKEMNPWLMITFEIVLLLMFYINYEFRGLKAIAKLDFSDIELFVLGQKNKTQKKR